MRQFTHPRSPARRIRPAGAQRSWGTDPDASTECFGGHSRQERSTLYRRHAGGPFRSSRSRAASGRRGRLGSTDGTLRIVRSFPATLIQIRPEDLLRLRPQSGGSQRRRRDCRHAERPLAARQPGLASHADPAFQRAAVAGVYGRQLPRSNATLLELLGMRLTGG